MLGADSDTSPDYLPATFTSDSVNRQYRGAINKSRPGFIERELVVANGQPEGTLERFIFGNFQGAMAYRSIKPDSNDGIVCAVGGRIYFLLIKYGKAIIHELIAGNTPNFMHTWFVQAEDWVYIQNGQENPIAWDGVLGNPAYRLNPAAGTKNMPIGTIMAYSNGRVFVSDANNNIYASDIIFGNGFTVTSNTQNFTETDYWQEGGSFTPPSNLGNITGMRVMPTLNLNDRGQGELVVFCDRGAFTLNTLLPRDTWKDAQILKTSLIGRGNLSPWSITGVNNETFFRADDGWALYSNAQVDFTQKLAFRKFSREVNKWVSSDTKILRQFASGMFYNNRFFGTVNPFIVAPIVQDQGLGFHRPHRGMIVLDLDYSTAPAPDASINWRWNGLWVGPQPTQLLTAFIQNQERAFVFSFDADGQNRIYEIDESQSSDYAQNKTVPIRSYFNTKRYDFADTEATNRYLRKELIGGEFWASNLQEQVNFDVEYRAENYPCWEILLPEKTIGCPSCSITEGCNFVVNNPRDRRLKSPTPDINICQLGSDIPAPIGSDFQVQVNMVGTATIERFRLAAYLQGNVDLPLPDCDEEENCEPIACCSLNNLDYYRIVNPAESRRGAGRRSISGIPTAGNQAPPDFCNLSLNSAGGDEGYDQIFTTQTNTEFDLVLNVEFETFTIMDRLQIRAYSNITTSVIIVDSGCIATSTTGLFTAQVKIPQGTIAVRFTVIPLCDGTPGGTVWQLRSQCAYTPIS